LAARFRLVRIVKRAPMRTCGTVLVADCRTSSGAILRSSLDTRHCRSGAQIGNVDGLLCGR
jgi:hypothetical protein